MTDRYEPGGVVDGDTLEHIDVDGIVLRHPDKPDTWIIGRPESDE